ncbi:EAL domain-containing protein [Paenibacillus sp. Soil522]|uniref:EAL domain-containing protein n=1 Tax=Paenibacillus sp. Soil522 TaxID=1736388 RepID=UPI000AC4A284
MNWEEFEVYYQPRINTATNQIVSAEALIRWNHPNWGELAPGEFISLSEKNGSIHSIGMRVLETVCQQIKWGETAGVPMRISVGAVSYFTKNAVQQNSRLFVQQSRNRARVRQNTDKRKAHA